MKTLRCPSCNITIEVLACVTSATCDGGGTHRQVRMIEIENNYGGDDV